MVGRPAAFRIGKNASVQRSAVEPGASQRVGFITEAHDKGVRIIATCAPCGATSSAPTWSTEARAACSTCDSVAFSSPGTRRRHRSSPRRVRKPAEAKRKPRGRRNERAPLLMIALTQWSADHSVVRSKSGRPTADPLDPKRRVGRTWLCTSALTDLGTSIDRGS